LLLPENKRIGNNNDLLLRYLDCAVIETLHLFNPDYAIGSKERAELMH